MAMAALCQPAQADVENGARFVEVSQPVRDTARFGMMNTTSFTGENRHSIFKAPDDGREYTTVLEEDFSLCTAGSDIDPNPEFINTANYKIPSQYTHTPGWGGRAVMQAGGAICLGKYTDTFTGTEMTGQIETPELDLHRNQGTAYLTFRAKSMPNVFDMVSVRWVAETDMLPVTGEEQTFPVNGLQWSTIEVELTDCPSNAVIQIFSESSELFIDDIKVEQFQPEIEAPTALKWTDFTGDSFTANWTAVEGADHYVFNCFYIRRQGSEDQLPSYKYIAKDVEVTDNFYHLENLDPTKVYYYYVRAVTATGVLSEESEVVEVLALTVPSGIRVSDISKEGFLVEWDPVLNAEGYGFQAVLDHKALTDETYALLDENFDKIVNDGTIGQPYVNNIGLYDMDSYGLSRANWIMYEGGVINGALAFTNSVSSYGTEYYGELVSPIMSIGQSTGDITIEADFASLEGVHPYVQIAVPGVVDGQNQWVLGAGGEIKQTIGKDWTHVKATYKVNPGLVRFSIGCTDGGWLYMDNLKISVNLPKDAVQRVLYHYNEIKEGLDAPGYFCNTPDRTQGDTYSFALMAARQRPGSYMIPVYVLSDWTDLTPVSNEGIDWSGIESVATDATSFSATATCGSISVLNPAGENLSVVSVSGLTVARTSASEATISLTPGLYIVASDSGKAVKLLVK